MVGQNGIEPWVQLAPAPPGGSKVSHRRHGGANSSKCSRLAEFKGSGQPKVKRPNLISLSKNFNPNKLSAHLLSDADDNTAIEDLVRDWNCSG
jgi:hypothetical protein